MFISVIVPTYNRLALLQRTLDSLFRQDYPDFEIIVVNDGSTDGTHEYLSGAAVPGNFKYLHHENRGLAATRKRGLEHARGDIIAFTDDDCVVPPNWLTKIAARLTGTVAGVGGVVRTGNPSNIFAVATDLMQNYYKDAINRGDVKVPFLTGNNVAYKRSSLEKVGGPDPRFRMGAEDRDLTFRIAQTGGALVYDPSIVIDHYHDSDLLRFLKHQYDFGTGSYLFYTITKRSNHRPSPLPLRVYLGMFLVPFREHGLVRAVLLCGLFVLSQLAVTVGFLAGTLRSSEQHPAVFA